VVEGVWGMTVTDETERLAWVVLQAANRTQAKGTTVRLVVPRAPEVARELGMELTDAQFVSVEDYLQEQGYVTAAGLGLSWGTYTLTPAGLKWLGASDSSARPKPMPTDRLRELAHKPGEEPAFESAIRAELEEERRRMEAFERELNELRWDLEPGAAEPPPCPGERRELWWRTATEPRPWWRRVFGG
jgi:hypothetical protein